MGVSPQTPITQKVNGHRTLPSVKKPCTSEAPSHGINYEVSKNLKPLKFLLFLKTSSWTNSH